MSRTSGQGKMEQKKPCYWTAREIFQQPAMWLETMKLVQSRQTELQKFLADSRVFEEGEVILTGAGSSEFVGNTLVSYLEFLLPVPCRSLASTDLIPTCAAAIDPDRPTLLVSFARSGDSPESLGTIRLAERRSQRLYHLLITCNSQGALAQWGKDRPRCFLMVLPEATHDRGFAMTSSFSSMYLAAALAFQPALLEKKALQVEQIAGIAALRMEQMASALEKIINDANFQRVVYLGSGQLKGIAQEAALKMLELSGGQTAVLHDSILGFRHGPKSFLNHETLTVLLFSQQAYRRQYEVDLLRELLSEGKSGKVLVLTPQPLNQAIDNAQILELEEFPEWLLSLLYLLAAQWLAFFQSIKLGLNPDDPCPGKEVNRVVQGVTIYLLEEEKEKKE